MNTKIRKVTADALSYSKWVLAAIAIIVAVKFAVNPGADLTDVVLWRLAQIIIVLPPIVFIGMFLYCYFGFNEDD